MPQELKQLEKPWVKPAKTTKIEQELDFEADADMF